MMVRYEKAEGARARSVGMGGCAVSVFCRDRDIAFDGRTLVDEGGQMTQNRYNQETNFLPAQSAQQIQVQRYEPPQSQVIDVTVATATAQPVISEAASPVGRSVALLIRLIPIFLVWLLLGFGLAWMVDDSGLGLPLLFAGVLSSITFFVMDKNERADSAVGLEKYKINALVALKQEQMRQEASLRRQALSEYTKLLEVNNDKPVD